MIDTFPNFRQISYNHSLVKDWKYIQIDKDDNIRLYYQPNSEPGRGFHFVLLNYVTGLAKVEDNWHDDPTLCVNTTLFGLALFDGLRCVYFANNIVVVDLDLYKTDGCNYYQHSKVMIRVFQELAKLEEKYCADVDYIKLYGEK